MEQIIYYVDQYNNYYIDMNNNYYIAGILRGCKPYIYINNEFKKVVPYIKLENSEKMVKMKNYCFV
jgi:hypothetical protein